MKEIAKLFVLWFAMGTVYYVIEVLWRLPRGELPHWSMIIVGGCCGVLVGTLNQHPNIFNLPIFAQCVMGTGITLAVEFVAGCILNLWLGLGIWDYSNLWGNLYGQVCIQFAGAWFILMPLCIWLEDTLRLGFGWDGKRYSLYSIYEDLIFLR